MECITKENQTLHYFVEDADVWIVHIRHSARRPLDESI
jgi:toxin ParE1/3/4